MWSECRVPVTTNQAGGGVLNRLQPVHENFRDADRITESCSSPGDRKRTPEVEWTNVLLASSNNDRTACRS